MSTYYQMNKPVPIKELTQFGIETEKRDNDTIVLNKNIDELAYDQLAEEFKWLNNPFSREMYFKELGYFRLVADFGDDQNHIISFTCYGCNGLFAHFMEKILGEIGYQLCNEHDLSECMGEFQKYCGEKFSISPDDDDFDFIFDHFQNSDYSQYLNEYVFEPESTSQKAILERYWNDVGAESFKDFQLPT